MKRRFLILISILFLLSGCSKYDGAWCRYGEVFSTLVIADEGINEKDLNYIENVVKKLEYLKSYDIVNNIDGNTTTINIYFTNKDGMNSSELILKKLKGVSRVELNSFLAVKERVLINGSDYSYGIELDNINANEQLGKYKSTKDVLELDNGVILYYKDNYLCSDQECNIILKKSKTNTCN